MLATMWRFSSSQFLARVSAPSLPRPCTVVSCHSPCLLKPRAFVISSRDQVASSPNQQRSQERRGLTTSTTTTTTNTTRASLRGPFMWDTNHNDKSPHCINAQRFSSNITNRSITRILKIESDTEYCQRPSPFPCCALTFAHNLHASAKLYRHKRDLNMADAEADSPISTLKSKTEQSESGLDEVGGHELESGQESNTKTFAQLSEVGDKLTNMKIDNGLGSSNTLSERNTVKQLSDALEPSKGNVVPEEEGQAAVGNNTRPPNAPPSSVLEAMESSAKWRNVYPRDVYKFANSDTGYLVVSQGSVVGFHGDAIVNAANEGCLGGGGVDGAINREGGQVLAKARQDLPVLPGTRNVRCHTGDAVITIGGNLNSSFCIHAVGPQYTAFPSLEAADEILRKAYLAAMKRAEEKNLKTIAFSLLSAGIFRGNQSLDRVVEIGVEAIQDGFYKGLEEVHMCAFTDSELGTLKNAAKSSFHKRLGSITKDQA